MIEAGGGTLMEGEGGGTLIEGGGGCGTLTEAEGEMSIEAKGGPCATRLSRILANILSTSLSIRILRQLYHCAA